MPYRVARVGVRVVDVPALGAFAPILAAHRAHVRRVRVGHLVRLEDVHLVAARAVVARARRGVVVRRGPVDDVRLAVDVLEIVGALISFVTPKKVWVSQFIRSISTIPMCAQERERETRDERKQHTPLVGTYIGRHSSPCRTWPVEISDDYERAMIMMTFTDFCAKHKFKFLLPHSCLSHGLTPAALPEYSLLPPSSSISTK